MLMLPEYVLEPFILCCLFGKVYNFLMASMNFIYSTLNFFFLIQIHKVNWPLNLEKSFTWYVCHWIAELLFPQTCSLGTDISFSNSMPHVLYKEEAMISTVS